jgi:hypothetical protein
MRIEAWIDRKRLTRGRYGPAGDAKLEITRPMDDNVWKALEGRAMSNVRSAQGVDVT